MRQPIPAVPDTDASLAVTAALALAVPVVLLVATFPGAVAGGAALVAAGYLLARVRESAAVRARLPRRRVCVPGTTACVDV
ncbi:hypothetical protein [Candidatus Halobonum tyrrellensis]|uniref:Uncharacterized protein n=1 Tax=Candidatus Halobonum tyrrellensis G22 TaxID=1324957 RepID=V4GWA5_9EURY|nr:hypothetical protein [Candidatus Halobonum tyrrellensis]ESP89436.1 hypothetical protein K933_04026 [Candidatus Halobonum tyrrellensis G22]